MKFFWILSLTTLLISSVTFSALPKDDDELIYLPKGTKFINQKDILIPAGYTRILFQNGLATLESTEINGNNRYCFMLLRNPSTRDRILEHEVAVITNGTYRSATGIVELEIAQPTGIFDIGCINPPAEFERRPTIGQFKKEVSGIFEVVMPGPDPLK
ncbi:MAG: hypothetical protein FJ112_09035 [Deltaproteobacteria bacterium]|nr:hypothetical protein [Deltaproteobacteria bacterium]